MPLTTVDRIVVVRALHLARPDWLEAGIDKAVREHLAGRPESARELLFAAIDIARDERHLTPATLTWTQPVKPPARPVRRLPCATHGGTTWRTEDQAYACCWSERKEASG